MRNKEKSVTVKDVAKLANVVPSTVSLVLNGSDKIKPETKKRVMDAVKELNYVPNNFAVSLRQSNSLSVGVIVPDMYNPFYWEIIKGLKEKCNELSIPIYVLETKYDLQAEQKHVDLFRSIRVNAFVFIGTGDDSEIVESISYNPTNKIVFIDKLDTTGKIPYIIIDNYKSAYEATDYLINNGCKNIYYITQNILTSTLTQRRDGAIDALKMHNLYDPSKIIKVDDISLGKMESGYYAVNSILGKDKPDGIITSSDQIALGVLRSLHENGMSVPQDVSLIGFDNIDNSKYSIPSLTTISQPREQMGKLAFSLLTKKDSEYSEINNKYILIHDFIIRESVAKRNP